ncbi:MAG TPA: 23S rRNA (guanosine(2251)-2'-O)-methyltransferase RlmB [Pyrinomonadaceae bacterium]|nr:23S rRNA (guanosine(2251)-2'-O)-methyltransferase RlmB [Pyrinomonadaceae bacterium]HMP64021.1 23S rRNA (guanosine(2251)-2'-O)-methyltransferase RlmB [Pyrinomonadaceae bacterium]
MKRTRTSKRTAGKQERSVRSGRPVIAEKGSGEGSRQKNVGRMLFGAIPVLEAVKADPGRVERILVATGIREHRLNELYELARGSRIRIDRVSRDEIERVAPPGANHQGVVAFAAGASYTDPDELLDSLGVDAFLLVLDSIQDTGNLGAILRVAECAGVDGVVLPDRRSAGLTEAAAKASAGASEHLPVARVQNLNRLIEELKTRGLWVVGAAGHAQISYLEWDWTRPTALIMGNEADGLHRLVAENCDVLVKIPMYGRIDSLNVSVAAGVMLFEARRQREASKNK